MGRIQYIRDKADLSGVVRQDPLYTAGFPVGIIAVDLIYPKLPGNVANASTFSFPVIYKKVSFEIEALFAGDPAIRDQIIDAALELEAEGVRAIAGACGFFAHFQKDIRAVVHVPVYMSSLCQLPLIRTGLRTGEKIAVIAASGESVDEKLLSQVGGDPEEIIVYDVGSMESFAPIRYGYTELDNGRLTKDLRALARRIRKEHPEVGAILLECSDLPPYAWAFQEESQLPVYDFITLINWIAAAVTQQPYLGRY